MPIVHSCRRKLDHGVKGHCSGLVPVRVASPSEITYKGSHLTWDVVFVCMYIHWLRWKWAYWSGTLTTGSINHSDRRKAEDCVPRKGQRVYKEPLTRQIIMRGQNLFQNLFQHVEAKGAGKRWNRFCPLSFHLPSKPSLKVASHQLNVC